jgi:glycosyltransferase involved in cell wall biosynthesis
MKRPIRVLHCPATVAGNPQSLARAEKSLGLESRTVAFRRDRFNYQADEFLFEGGEGYWAKEARLWGLLWRAARSYDIIHFNFGMTFMPWYYPEEKYIGRRLPRFVYEALDAYKRLEDMCDLPLLKKAGKGIVVTYQGDDARQGDFCRTHFEVSPAEEVDAGYYTRASDEDKRHRIARFDKYADRIYAVNPDLLHVLPPRAEFLPYANVDPQKWAPAAPQSAASGQRLTVLHAPTHRGVKGTEHILRAVELLRARDRLDFEFVLVEGLPHSEVRRLYERADLLVDQLLCGWYGGLAVELMALAKPVVCYIREGDLKFIHAEMRRDLPIINATPASVYEVLKEWLTVRRGELAEVGRRSRAFVERWHDPLKIAARLKADYEAILASKRRAA